MERTVRFRLRANSKDKYHGLYRTAGDCRFVWNCFREIFKVNDYKDDYRHGTLGNILRDINNYWLNDMSAYILQHSLKDFSETCNRYNKGMSNEQSKKSKYKTTPSFPVNYHSARLSDNNWLRILKVGWFRLTGNNPYPDGVFKSGRIKKEYREWDAYLVYETEDKKEGDYILCSPKEKMINLTSKVS